MIKPITLSHPDITDSPETFLTTDYSSGVNLEVSNNASFAADDYVILGRPGLEQAEIKQINAVQGSRTLVMDSSGDFPHASDTTVVKIPYNQFRIYRSTTGVGGTYTLLATVNIQIDQLQNVYRDATSNSAYSYKLCFYNSTTDAESEFSDEIPFAGYPDWSLKAMQDAILGDFGDKDQKMIERSDITRWLNYINFKVQVYLMGGESPYYVNYIDITSTGAKNYDLNTYEMLGIFMVEISRDGGLTFPESITPKDFRFRDADGSITNYEYRLAGNKLYFTDKEVPTGNIMRIWYTTNPVPLQSPTDTLLNPLIPMLEVFHDYGMMRAHLKDRKPELSADYENRVNSAFNERNGIIWKLRKRIRQGNMAMASTNNDFFGDF